MKSPAGFDGALSSWNRVPRRISTNNRKETPLMGNPNSKPPARVLLEFIDDVANTDGTVGRLLCPVCKFECTHTTGEATVGIEHAVLQIDCEAGHRTVITLSQHKGDTDIHVESANLIGFR